MNIICDLDGTIALDHHRAHFLHPMETRDWESYFAACAGDAPNQAVIKILRAFHLDHTIYILSGRSHSTLPKTIEWLVDNGVPFNILQLRHVDDRTDDHILKMQWAKEFNLTPENTLFVLEDRRRVVEAWRSSGFTVLQVADGNF